MKNKEDLADAYINQFISLSKFDHTRPKQKETKRGKNKIPKPKKNNGGKKKQVNQSSNLDASMADFMNKRKILKRSTSESFMLPQSSIEKPISPYDQAYTKDALQPTPLLNPKPSSLCLTVLKISSDYDYLKEKVLKLQQKLAESERDNKELEKQLETIKTQNIKL